MEGSIGAPLGFAALNPTYEKRYFFGFWINLSTARAAATMPKVAVTIITAPKPPAQSRRTPSPTKLFCWQTLPSGLG
ncbi:hypothetical protein Q3H58_004331 [Pseudomonas psychrotolerans]|nr:hypothetical protein [Pseudomonas psychrotolerans]